MMWPVHIMIEVGISELLTKIKSRCMFLHLLLKMYYLFWAVGIYLHPGKLHKVFGGIRT